MQRGSVSSGGEQSAGVNRGTLPTHWTTNVDSVLKVSLKAHTATSGRHGICRRDAFRGRAARGEHQLKETQQVLRLLQLWWRACSPDSLAFAWG